VSLSPAFGKLRKHDVQLTLSDDGVRGGHVEGARNPYGAGKASKLALHEMERSWSGRSDWRFLAHDDQDIASEDHPNGPWRNAGHVRENFDRLSRFQDVHGGVALARPAALVRGKSSSQLVEQLLYVLADFRGIARGNQG